MNQTQLTKSKIKENQYRSVVTNKKTKIFLVLFELDFIKHDLRLERVYDASEANLGFI